VLAPCVAPKFCPAMVTVAPEAAGFGETPIICGGTVKLIPSLGALLIVTVTGPDVAAAGTVVLSIVFVHEVTVALAPLKASELLP
jgi:hypothetical protein